MSFFTRFRRRPAQAQTTAADDLTTDSNPEQTDSNPGHTPGDDTASADAAGAAGRPVWRTVVAWVITALAALLVFAALVAPNRLSRVTPEAFVRLPVEALLGLALVLVLPPRPRRVVAALAGVVLGLLTIVKVLDMGFYEELARPFNLVLDWVLFNDAVSFLSDSVGRPGAIGAVVVAAVLIAAVPVLMTLSVLRLTRVAIRYKTTTARSVVVLGVVWVTCAVLGVQVFPGIPVTSRNTVGLAYHRARQVPESLRDKAAFAKVAAVDAFRDTPDDQLLTALRGKDVVVSFIESYGRSAIEDPQLKPLVDAALDTGTRQLDAAGFASRSAFLTSPTYGGGSWLAHSTFLSGLWINNQQRYRTLVSSDRFTLTRAFRRASWRTVGVEPGTTYAWPEGTFYGYNQVYDGNHLGYHGPKFSWSTMPDQYTLSAFQRCEYATPNRGPLMAEITLTSSHSPWAPIPQFLSWNDVGDGAVYGPIAKKADPPSVVWKSRTRVRTEYARSIAYSINSLVSYVETYGNKNLVLVFLGDHQPATTITGEGASRDVPITIVAHDRSVLDRISGWGWQDGLKPGPKAPVWRMDAFRDRFLTAFGSPANPTPTPSPPPR